MAKQMAHDDDDDENKCQQEFYTLITSRKLFYGLCVCVFFQLPWEKIAEKIHFSSRRWQWIYYFIIIMCLFVHGTSSCEHIKIKWDIDQNK